MLLILGDSFAHWAGARDMGPGVVARGWRGARLADEEFRRWAINVTLQQRPRDVLLIVGGNDVACPQFSPRLLGQMFQELILGIYAAGAEYVLNIPPRSVTRPGSASVSVYRRRRRLINLMLRRLSRRPASGNAPRFALREVALSPGFLGRDGVHPSPTGWRDLGRVIHDILAV